MFSIAIVIKKGLIITDPKESLKMYSTLNSKSESLSLPLRSAPSGIGVASIPFGDIENNIFNPYYVIGFTDAIGSFLINVALACAAQKRSNLILGYSISLYFKIKLYLIDKELLKKILNFFNVALRAPVTGTLGVLCCAGFSISADKIYIRKDGYIEYIVNFIKDLEVIINLFNNYPLITQKLSDYKLFKLVFELIIQKKPLTKEGFRPGPGEMLSLKASFNNGLSEKFKRVFPNIIPYLKPQTITPKLETKDTH